MRYYITDIDWCVDEAEDLETLPTNIWVKADDEDGIADALSDEYGFLVNSFNVTYKNN